MKLEEKRTMTKAKKQFSPHIFAEWGELFEPLSVEQKAELLMAITKFPNYEPANVPIWAFIKSQLVKDYEIFIEKCNKNGQISRDYWNKKNYNDIERLPNDIERLPNDTERLPNDTERHPKRITNNDITNNKLQITNNEITKTEINNNFEEFYSLYPRKEAKQKALQAYLKAIKKVDKDTLLEGLKKYIDYIKTNKKEREFIKHPATWLNQGCWEDEYSVKANAQNLADVAMEILRSKE